MSKELITGLIHIFIVTWRPLVAKVVMTGAKKGAQQICIVAEPFCNVHATSNVVYKHIVLD